MQQQANYDSELCGSLPIHLTNLIQPYGILLVIDRENLNIIQCSENTQGVFSKPAKEVVNCPLVSFIGKEALDELQGKLSDGFSNKIPAIWEVVFLCPGVMKSWRRQKLFEVLFMNMRRRQ
jgi:chemotaxis family two-component system sensor kinase Cph1